MTASHSGYAPVNGVSMYYEVHGQGRPLVLLHGGLGMIDLMFGGILPLLARDRQVIAVEFQGHGHTADIDRPLRYELLAGDVGALIAHLGLGRADVMGYSLGGGVAWQTAIRHPEQVNRLVVLAAACRRNALFPEVRAGLEALGPEVMTGSPWVDEYARRAPVADGWRTLIDKTREMLSADYDWSAHVASITAPVLFVAADSDIFPVEHAAEIFSLLGGNKGEGDMAGRPASRLAIIPGATHQTLLTHTDTLLPAIAAFLSAEAQG